MGRGASRGTLERAPGPRAHRSSLSPAFDQRGGPEATSEEIDAWAGNDVMLRTAHRTLTDPLHTERYSAFAPRRALEAALALWHGQDPAAYKRMNAHRSWAELNVEAQRIDTSYHGGLRAHAVSAEQAHRLALRGEANSAAFAADDDLGEDLRQLIEQTGRGARSGRIEDYDRRELCKLLGYLQREARRFSDDDLRAMALDAHLIPRFNGSPAHAVLAAQRASLYSSPQTRRREFQKMMRTPYKDLVSGVGNGSRRDDGNHSPQELLDRLRARHPFAAAGLNARDHRHLIRRIARQNGIDERLPDSERRRPGTSTQRYMTALAAQFQPAFVSFCGLFGGAPNLRHVKRGPNSKRTWGSFARSSGDVTINPKLLTLVEKAKRGNAAPAEIEDAVGTVAHELVHASEGYDQGNERTHRQLTHTPEHTLDEGRVEALGRLHVQDLAELMEVWDPERDGNLRERTSARQYYDFEVQTVVALAAAAAGEFNPAICRAGGYAEPERLGERGRRWLKTTTGELGLSAHVDALAASAARHGRASLTEDETRARIREILGLCKDPLYIARRGRERQRNPIARRPDLTGPELSCQLADMISALF